MATESPKPIVTINFAVPKEWGKKETLTHCDIYRRPITKDCKGLSLSDGTLDDQIVLLSRISNLTPPQIDILDMYDTQKCMEVITGFLQNSPETGKKS